MNIYCKNDKKKRFYIVTQIIVAIKKNYLCIVQSVNHEVPKANYASNFMIKTFPITCILHLKKLCNHSKLYIRVTYAIKLL